MRYARFGARLFDMSPNYLSIRLTNLPPEVTKSQLEYCIRRVASNRSCTLSIGPIVQNERTSEPTASATATICGSDSHKVLEDFQMGPIFVASLADRRAVQVDTEFLGPTVLAENRDSFLE